MTEVKVGGVPEMVEVAWFTDRLHREVMQEEVLELCKAPVDFKDREAGG